MERHATTLVEGLGFPEGLRWHDGTFWCSDMRANAVLTIGLDGAMRRAVATPGPPSGLGWLPDGRLLVVSMHDRKVLRLDPEGLVEHADLGGIATYHANDMVVDRRGRAYVGNFGFDFMAYIATRTLEEALADPDYPTAALAVVDPDGTARVAADGLLFPNGMAITPDGGTLIVAESNGPYLTAFRIGADGALAGRRRWATMARGVPDGICLDTEGAVWVASPSTAECLRLAAGGAVLDRVATSQGAYSCALGGPDGRTLFIATAPSAATTADAAAGRIETAAVAVPGTGSP